MLRLAEAETETTTVQQLNARLQRAFLHRAVERSRYENYCLRTLLTQWRATTAAVVEQVQQAGLYAARRETERLGLGLVWPGRQQALARLLGAVAALIGGWTHQAAQCVQLNLTDLVSLDLREIPDTVNRLVAQTERAVQEAEGDPLLSTTFASVPESVVTELLGTPLGGAHFATSFGDLAATTLTRLRNALLVGLTQGQGVPQVTRSVQGVLGNTRWQAERIVRSEFGRVANQAALAQFDANSALLAGVRWVATLDRRTCLICSALDGRVWADPRQAKVPVTDTHPICRCIVIPVVRGLPGVTLPAGARASAGGAVPDTLTYPEWFKEQPVGLQREILGPTRYGLWSRGKVDLPDFVSARGIRSVASVLRSAS